MLRPKLVIYSQIIKFKIEKNGLLLYNAVVIPLNLNFTIVLFFLFEFVKFVKLYKNQNNQMKRPLIYVLACLTYALVFLFSQKGYTQGTSPLSVELRFGVNCNLNNPVFCYK